MSTEKRLEGKVAIVTGGARGIGKAICSRLAAEGASLAIVDIMLDVAQATADEFKAAGVNARAYAANVAKPEDADKTVADVIADFGKVDILVNNAGITKDTLMLKMTEDMWDAVIAVNLKGTFNFTKAVVRPMMKQRSGRIISMSSVVGAMGNAGQVNYAAAKAGLVGMTMSLAREIGSRGITVNCIAPGFIDTDMTKDLPEEHKTALIGQTALGRLGQTDDVANACLYLASPAGAYVTGIVLHVNGGMYMG